MLQLHSPADVVTEDTFKLLSEKLTGIEDLKLSVLGTSHFIGRLTRLKRLELIGSFPAFILSNDCSFDGLASL